ncbi:hypothetical protein SLOPH_2320 [Spraguea lophii 42_110]|uniref:Uncharacterized protein n=1 Tax=Spraguea lophii (strain 42_110) TaxID=1358809 RepID=S7W567_SPRLO|nr:hypothetical protein SLOPH_2320 [Spraguea lophii 42_110]
MFHLHLFLIIIQSITIYEKQLIKDVTNDIIDKIRELQNLSYNISKNISSENNIIENYMNPFNSLTFVVDQLKSIHLSFLSNHISYNFIEKEIKPIRLNFNMLKHTIYSIENENTYNKKIKRSILHSLLMHLKKDIEKIELLLDELSKIKRNMKFEIMIITRNLLKNFLDFMNYVESRETHLTKIDKERIKHHLKCTIYFINRYFNDKIKLINKVEYQYNNKNIYIELYTRIKMFEDKDLTNMSINFIAKEIKLS